jgi:uncharacterized repeat protein (TIGR03803 family)
MTATLTTLVNFNFTNGAFPYDGLIADANGDLFGTTNVGGANNDGTVFEIVNTGTAGAPIYASSPTTLVTFNGADGQAPSAGSLLADANGDLFGTTYFGGANNDGTVFEMVNTGTAAAPSYASSPTTLVSFDGTDGGPDASLIADSHGDLFGTTLASGAANGAGTVFEIVNTGTAAAPIYASSPTTLVSLNGINGGSLGPLLIDAHGDLFGTTLQGGANGDGSVFEIVNTGTTAAPSYASTPTTLVSFNGTNGEASLGHLVVDAHGDLFGVTNTGGANNDGTVFEMVNTGTAAAPSYASSPTTLVSFNGGNGANPYGGLIADAHGDLFGTTQFGGANNDGTVFEIANIGTATAPIYASSPTTLVSFDGTNGAISFSSLLADSNGDLFGTTHSGGAR